MQFYLVVSLIFALLVSIFALQNFEVVTIKFLTMNLDISLVLVIFGSAIMGALSMFLLNMFREVGSWRKLREAQSKIKQLEQKNAEQEKRVAEFEAQAVEAVEAVEEESNLNNGEGLKEETKEE